MRGTVYRATPGAAKATPWIPARPTDLTRGVGVFAHEPSDTLWVCSADPDPVKNTTILRAFDLKTAALKGTYPFPGGGFCNDVEVMRDGTTLATDTRGGRILALEPGATALDVWVKMPNGPVSMAELPDGDVLINNVRQNLLVHVAVKPDVSAGAATFLSSRSQSMVPTVCGRCRTDVLSWPRTVAERSISSVSREQSHN